MKVLFVGARGNGKSKILNDLMDVYGELFAYIDVNSYRGPNENETDEIAERIMKDAQALESEYLGVFIGAEIQNKEIRDRYMDDGDIQVIVEKYSFNEKTERGLNDNFNPNYDGIKIHANFDRFQVETFIEYFFRKVYIDCFDELDDKIKMCCKKSFNLFIEECNIEKFNSDDLEFFKAKYPFIKLNPHKKGSKEFFAFYDIVLSGEEFKTNVSNDVKKLMESTELLKVSGDKE